ncbi:MAG TPA: SMP-30/gluconolactonase/LRE family protein [Methylibium sp.]|uniref:SMP-30/gluconolactonase/LRE family protein n=1 Tax=Methylibium sp. TaxID=2067992 RepID=UPI002DBDEF1A|nr:SMP-30/gluconolactonase/LRE family protein [Methylibium sp.]HEU4459525.1 SMP-30/gluconolactonase/LRE family protein [Methylibium sp.]
MNGTRLDAEARCVVDARCALGESPVWSADEGALYWADIDGYALHRWRAADGVHDRWPMPAKLGCLALAARGGLLLALGCGLHRLEAPGGALERLIHPGAAHPRHRYNDGKAAPDGSFWVGTMDDHAERLPESGLWRIDAKLEARRVASGFRTLNGLAWSPDGRTLYFSDSRAATVWCAAHDPDTGAIGERRVFVAMEPAWGKPDGAAVDVEGCYWNAGHGAGRINRFAPDGRLVGHVELPVTNPTMPCFGGADLRTLYVTSARAGLDAAALARTPSAGGVFAFDAGVAGVPVARFAG